MNLICYPILVDIDKGILVFLFPFFNENFDFLLRFDRPLCKVLQPLEQPRHIGKVFSKVFPVIRAYIGDILVRKVFALTVVCPVSTIPGSSD